MVILGISAYYHDSASAIVVNGEIIAAAQEERFTRIKHDPNFPANAIEYCLEAAGVSLSEVDQVVFYDKPFLKFERLLETYYNFAPKGFASFIKAMPVWLHEKLFLKKIIRKELAKIEECSQFKLLFCEHHLSHSASAFFPSPFKEAAILTVDGVGEWATASISKGEGHSIKVIKDLNFPHSVGLLYSAFTYYLGFRVNSGEYKLMGLAPYGDPKSEETHRFIELIQSHLIDLKEDGSVGLNQSYFDYAAGLKMTHNRKWKDLFGLEKRQPESDLNQSHCNLAFAIQAVTEKIVLKLARTAHLATGSENLCLAGGVALNCVANGKLLRQSDFKNIWIQPAAGDAGGALGAAMAAHHIFNGSSRNLDSKNDQMKGSYLGPSYDGIEIESMATAQAAPFKKYDDFSQLCLEVANELAEEKVVGWFQGRSEWGPRSLGNRSILGDPRSVNTQRTLNLKIKYRESFRPFAPSVLLEESKKYFDLPGDSPYMLLVAPVAQSRQRRLPEDFFERSAKDRLYFERSDLPSITHLDHSARVQTVDMRVNPRYHQLIETFAKKTGVAVLVNTSFNVRGEPIVLTPEDAYRCFMRTEMDFLVIDNYLFRKEDQKPWPKTDDWQAEYALD